MSRLALLSAFALTSVNAAVIQYSYDSINRLSRVAYADGTVISYTYDFAGNRTSQVISNPSVSLPTIGADKSSLTFSAAAGQASAGTQIITIRNTGAGALQWNASASVPWISVTPGSGTDTGVINVSASAASLTAGSYTGNVMIFASASNAPTVIPVIFTVTAAQGNPSIKSGGITSAAGFQPGVTRGSVATIFGSALAGGTAQAESVPLPRSLSNVKVTVNGVDAPLWYVDSGQINFQIPYEAPLQGSASIVVTRDGVSSSPSTVNLVPYAPSVFLYQRAEGVFDPIIVHAATNQLVTPTNPAIAGEYVVVYGTGIGDLTLLPETGGLSPSPAATAKVLPAVTIGGVSAQQVTFAGLTPGAIGLVQFNVQLPTALFSGSSVPLVINFGGVASAPVNLAIQPGKPTANVQYTFTPNSVTQSADGRWSYSGALQETGGVGVTFTKLTWNGVDYTSSIASWVGSTRLAANGQLQGSFGATCPTCTSAWDGNWQFTGNDDNGHTGLTWAGSVHFVPATTPAIGTFASGLSSIAGGLAVDAPGNVYYLENHSVKKVSPGGNVTVVAGNGTPGFSGDGGPATSAQLNSPQGVAVDPSGRIYIADYMNRRIRRVDTNGVITTFAGNGINTDAGDGGAATSASFAQIGSVAADASGNVYVITALTVRKIDKNGIVTRVAGDSQCTGGGFRGDGGPGPNACLYVPSGLAFKANGNIYVADGLNKRVRQVDTNGIITTFAGNGQSGSTGDGGPATQAAIGFADGIAADQAGNVFVSSCGEQRVHMISPAGTITTVAGTGVAGFSGDNGSPGSAQLSCPSRLAMGPDGALYVLDSTNLRIRRISLLLPH